MVVLRPWAGLLRRDLAVAVIPDRAPCYDAPGSFQVALKLRKDLREKFCFTAGEKAPRLLRRIGEVVD